MPSAHEVLYAAATTELGLVVRGSAKELRKARSAIEDGALSELAILGPDGEGNLWIVRKDKVQKLVDRTG